MVRDDWEEVPTHRATPRGRQDATPEADDLNSRGAPLVLDLPAGQKLLIGDFPSGTTIEVATWTGTSPPDNRTTRLLLGVTRDDVVTGNTDLSQEADVSSPEVLRRRRPPRRGQRAWIAVLISVVVVASVVLVCLLSPLKFLHPQVGLSLGFGTARSVVAVTVPSEDAKAGETIVASGTDDEVVIGRVAATGDDTVLLQTDSGYTQVTRARVIGTVVLIIPFVGYLF